MQIGPFQIGAPESVSYSGSAVSIGASLTLTQVGVFVGIVTAVLTYATTAYFQWRKDQREEAVARAQIEEIAHREAPEPEPVSSAKNGRITPLSAQTEKEVA